MRVLLYVYVSLVLLICVGACVLRAFVCALAGLCVRGSVCMSVFVVRLAAALCDCIWSCSCVLCVWIAACWRGCVPRCEFAKNVCVRVV